MSDNEIKEACAKLDGWIHHFDIIHGEITDQQVDGWHKESGEEISKLPNYLKSYDVLIPLAQKYLKGRMFDIETTPRQLAISVLKETGLWKD